MIIYLYGETLQILLVTKACCLVERIAPQQAMLKTYPKWEKGIPLHSCPFQADGGKNSIVTGEKTSWKWTMNAAGRKDSRSRGKLYPSLDNRQTLVKSIFPRQATKRPRLKGFRTFPPSILYTTPVGHQYSRITAEKVTRHRLWEAIQKEVLKPETRTWRSLKSGTHSYKQQ